MTTPWSQDEYLETYTFAASAHLGQEVPGSELPYIVHVNLVTMEVIAALRAEPDRDESLAVRCALLHDVLEDTAVSHEEIERRFGAAVAAGVRALSKNDALEKSARMADSLRRIREQPREVWMVKLADRITNLQPPPAHWTKEKIGRYLNEAEVIRAALRDASPFLHARLQNKMKTYATRA
ncbi:MAG: HD domain-containing protein [Acidobacteriota bacterium]